MSDKYGDFVIPSTDGTVDVIKRKDVIDSLVFRWQVNGLKCERAEECLADVETAELVEWMVMAVLDIMPTCPKHRAGSMVAVMRLPDGIEN